MGINQLDLKRLVIQKADQAHYTVMNNLSVLYAYELSKYAEDNAIWRLPPTGIYDSGCSDLSAYFDDADKQAFYLSYAKEPVGFMLLDQSGFTDKADWNIAEFFIARRYQGHGVGKAAAQYLFDHYPGLYHIGVMEGNTPAINFWQNVIPNNCETFVYTIDAPVPQKLLIFALTV